MYVKDTLITVNFIIQPLAVPLVIGDYDVLIQAPDGTMVYTNGDLLTYSAPTTTVQGSGTFAFTPDTLGLYKCSLSVGAADVHIKESQVSLFVVTPIIPLSVDVVLRRLFTSLGTLLGVDPVDPPPDPEPEAVTDSYFNFTKLILTMIGADESTTFTDESPVAATVTPVGNAKIDTQDDPLTDGEGSLQLVADGDYLSIPYVAADYDWWTDDYTIDAWVYADSWATWDSGSPNNLPNFIGNQDSAGDSQFWTFGPNTAGQLELYYWNGAQQSIVTVATMTTGAWHHIALTHHVGNGQVTFYIDGVIEKVGFVAGTPQSSGTYPLLIGRASGESFTGRATDIRITKGALRYLLGYTNPTVRAGTSIGTDGPLLPFGVANDFIQDAALTASTAFAGYESYEGRMYATVNTTDYWAAASGSSGDWWKVDLGFVQAIRAFGFHGSPPPGSQSEWIATYTLDYSDDDSTWTPYNSGEVLNGSVNKETIVVSLLTEFNARYLRMTVVTSNAWQSGRFEVYGSEHMPAGVYAGNGDILDAAITASSQYDGPRGPENARLYNPNGSHWAPSASSTAEWWKVDLGAIKEVSAFATQGGGGSSNWIKTYELEYNDDDSATWISYNSGEVLNGNVNSSAVVRNDLTPFSARYVRFRPKTWQTYISLRAELFVK